MSPEEALALHRRLEDAVLAAAHARCRFLCRADAPLDADLEGSLELSARGLVDLRVDGRLRGRPDHLRLQSDGTTMRVEGGGRSWSGSAPTQLIEAVAIGWLRLGLIDTIVQLANGEMPRRAAGGIRGEVELRPLSVVEGDDLNPQLANAIGLGCFVRVGGRDAQIATIWLDRDTAAPVQRTFTLTAPTLGWSIGVGEAYWELSLP